MTTLRISAAGRTWTFEEPRVVTVGREAGCDVVIDRPSVSRRHLQVRSQGAGWVLVDTGSSAGTWLGAQRVSSLPVSAAVRIRVGDGTTGVDLEVVPVAPAVPSTPSPFAPPPFAPTASPTVSPQGSPFAPPGFPDPGDGRPVGAVPPPSTPGTGMARDLEVTRIPAFGGMPGMPGMPGPPGPPGPGLVIRDNTRTLRFPFGRLVRIGREPGLEVVADDPAVSRQHAVVEPRPDGWWYVDRSTGGSYDDDGDTITQRKITEPTTIMLGHPTAGYELEVIPAVDVRTAQRGIAAKRRRRGMLVGAAVLAGVVVVAGGITTAVLLAGGGGGGHQQESGLERAKRASVFIIAEDESGAPVYTGSGSIISDTGLILTAGHVGEPEAPGENMEQSNPASLLIALTSPEDDKPVKAAFHAKPVVSDGVLDLSVLQIDADADGHPVKAADLAAQLPDPIPLGDSDELKTGDDITALGFPALASLESSDQLKPTLSVTKGGVATFESSSEIGSERAWIDSDVRIGSGNSGGASIDDKGALIGVNDAVITSTTAQGNAGEFTGGSALIRPVALAMPLIRIAKDGGDPSYTSPYLKRQQSQGATAKAAGWARTKSGCSAQSSPVSALGGVRAGDTVYVDFLVKGVADGTTTGIEVLDSTGTRLATATQPWSLGSGSVCVAMPVELKSTVPTGAIAYFSAGGQQLGRSLVAFR